MQSKSSQISRNKKISIDKNLNQPTIDRHLNTDFLTEENYLTSLDSLNKNDLIVYYENQMNELQTKLIESMNNSKENTKKFESDSDILVNTLQSELDYYKNLELEFNLNIEHMEGTIVKLVEKNEELQFELENYDFSKDQTIYHIDNKTSILKDMDITTDQTNMIEDLKNQCDFYEKTIEAQKENLIKAEEEKLLYIEQIQKYEHETSYKHDTSYKNDHNTSMSMKESSVNVNLSDLQLRINNLLTGKDENAKRIYDLEDEIISLKKRIIVFEDIQTKIEQLDFEQNEVHTLLKTKEIELINGNQRIICLKNELSGKNNEIIELHENYEEMREKEGNIKCMQESILKTEESDSKYHEKVQELESNQNIIQYENKTLRDELQILEKELISARTKVKDANKELLRKSEDVEDLQQSYVKTKEDYERLSIITNSLTDGHGCMKNIIEQNQMEIERKSDYIKDLERKCHEISYIRSLTSRSKSNSFFLNISKNDNNS